MKTLTRFGVEDVKFQEQDKPVIGEGEVLLKVEACGVCGTDMHVYKGMANNWKLPGVIGHEFSGEIAEIHDSVKNYKLGDKVTVQPLMNCGECDFCKEGKTNLCNDMTLVGGEINGGMAEFVAVKAKQLKVLPKDFELKYGALVEPTATVGHALNRRKNKTPKNAIIFGAGSLGLIALQLLKDVCEKVIVVDIAPKRLEVALDLGAYSVINSMEDDVNDGVAKAFNNRKADLIIDAAGVTPVRKAIFDTIRPGGEIICIALGAQEYTVDFMQLVTQEISVYGTQCHTMADDYDDAIAFIEKNTEGFDKVVTFLPLEEGEKALDTLAHNPNEYIKVAFTME